MPPVLLPVRSLPLSGLPQPSSREPLPTGLPGFSQLDPVLSPADGPSFPRQHPEAWSEGGGGLLPGPHILPWLIPVDGWGWGTSRTVLGAASLEGPAVLVVPALTSQPPGASFLSPGGRRKGLELCRVSLAEFQQFLLEHQGEVDPAAGVPVGSAPQQAGGLSRIPLSHPIRSCGRWDRLQVQEFMLSFLRPLREIEEPYFFLDEVRRAPPSD